MKKAFTLIELLVVIAIIAILAAILFPVFAQAKEAAKKTVCLSNTKGLATSVQLYAADYDDTVVPWLTCSGAATYCAGGPTNRDLRSWTGVIQPYVKNGGGHPWSGIFTDPSWTEAAYLKGADQATCDGDGTSGSAGVGTGSLKYYTDAAGLAYKYAQYGISFYMQANGSCVVAGAVQACAAEPSDYGRDGSTAALAEFLYAGSENYPVNFGGGTRGLGEIQRPAETVILGDGITAIAYVYNASTPGYYWNVALGCESSFMHSSGGNYANLDGHAKFLKGNPEAYRVQDSTGVWYEKWFDFAR